MISDKLYIQQQVYHIGLMEPEIYKYFSILPAWYCINLITLFNQWFCHEGWLYH